MKKKIVFTLALASALQINAQTDQAPSWLRWCAISPDGKNIAFTYQGDIYTVSANGGEARQLTANTAYDYAPVWSPDSKHIAFCSTREGSKDVFITSINGGNPRRITTNSNSEIPVAFLDADHLIFKAYGTPTTENIQFPTATFTQLYKVNVKGGRPELFSDWAMDNPSVGEKGILYEDIKGYEDYWRKHQTSSIARDIWLFDGKNYKKLTSFKGDDRSPVWTKDGKGFYYLSEQNGSFNVYQRSLNDEKAKQLTFHKDNPVRFLTASNDGTLCYSCDGSIYTVANGKKSKKVNIEITRDDMQREVIRRLYNSGVSDIAISPKNKEIAFIMQGDVYVTSMDYNTTKQITDTPERERNVDFAPDGRSVVYDSERDGRWQIYQTSIVKKDEKNFTYSTEIKEERLTDGTYTAFQPSYNPKGEEIAFLKNRTELCVLKLKNKKVRTVMDGKYQYSYQDGDQNYSWSPDGKWFLTEYIGNGGWNIADIALVKADGSGELHNLTESGYQEGNPKWVLGGKAMIFTSDRAGYRSHGSWGSYRDEYILFFDREAYDKFRMNKEDLALLEEQEKLEKEEKEKAEKEKAEKESKKKSKKDKKDDKKDNKKDEKKDNKKDEALKLDLNHLDEWTVRLTPYSTSLGDAILNKEGTKLYYIAPHEGSASLWEQDLKEHTNTLKMKGIGWANFKLDNEGKNAYFPYGGIKKLDIASGRTSNIGFEAFHTDRPAETRAYLFDHIWHQTKEKLYDPNMNGADWDKIYKTYSKYLPHINNNYDFAEMASEMLGELNVSHTGCRFGGYGGAMTTATLGAFYDESYKGDGLKIKEIMKGSPLEVGKKPIKAGAIILAIDGQEIKAGQDYFPLLEGKYGRYTRLTVEMDGKKFVTTVKPISLGVEQNLLYKRWVNRNKEIVDKLSNGRLAYVHIKDMDAKSFQELYKDLLSDKNRKRDAVIVDTRHNGGGWLHGNIITLLTGKLTMQYKPRGQYVGNDPFDRWTKPSCMLVCEDNYSNAHGTPWYYKEQGVGKLIGAPVPGTMTAVWWEQIEGGMVFGIPQVGAYDMQGNVLENKLLVPDVEIYNNPADVLNGKDAQLERAVKEMLKK